MSLGVERAFGHQLGLLGLTHAFRHLLLELHVLPHTCQVRLRLRRHLPASRAMRSEITRAAAKAKLVPAPSSPRSQQSHLRPPLADRAPSLAHTLRREFTPGTVLMAGRNVSPASPSCAATALLISSWRSCRAASPVESSSTCRATAGRRSSRAYPPVLRTVASSHRARSPRTRLGVDRRGESALVRLV